MGDIMEIIRRPRHPNHFYKVSSSVISFQLKAHNAALVGLSKEPGNICDYWIGFAVGGRIWIQGPDGQKSSNDASYSVSLNQFRNFWIAWDCGNLRVGLNNEPGHTLSYPYSNISLDYVTFCSQDPRNSAIWKIECPPASVIKVANSNNPKKKIQGGELRWVAAEDALPDNAVIGGFEDECLYIIRANYNGSLTPGKFVPSEGVAYVSWGGDANVSPEFEILCGYDFTWETTCNDRIPVDSFVAGTSEVNNEKLYIGRVNHNGNVIPGKVQPSHKVCYVSYGDKEMGFKDYEILTVPNQNLYSATPCLQVNMGAIIRHPHDLGLFVNVRVNGNRDVEEEEDEEDEEDEDAQMRQYYQ